MINTIMSMFLDDATIEILGNWYPRVYAVMSCVIPVIFILGVFIFLGLILREVFKSCR